MSPARRSIQCAFVMAGGGSSSLTLLVTLACCFSFAHCEKPDDESPILLVLSFDGLRADFLNEALMPNLYKLARQGVWAPNGVKAQVVTETAPNYYTIATGLYQENHGIIGNAFFDPVFGEVYDFWNMEDLEVAKRARDSKWYSGEPIWQTNEKSGGSSGGMRWPLCDIQLKNGTISRCFPWEDYGDLVSWTNDLEQLLFWFTDKKSPINLGFFYVSEPDHTQHDNDLYSSKVKAKLAELDALVWTLTRKLQTLNLHNRMNILFVSDHGHANVYSQHNMINLDEILGAGNYIRSSQSIFPNTRKGVTAEELYRKLKAARMKSPKFDVWWKGEVPDRYHYKNNRRIGPIVLIERLGYAFLSGKQLEKVWPPVFSSHGFSNDYFEMRPAFFAVGPAFQCGITIDWEIENVDLYNLMAAVMKAKPARNDGNFTRVSSLLQETYVAGWIGHGQVEAEANPGSNGGTVESEPAKKGSGYRKVHWLIVLSMALIVASK